MNKGILVLLLLMFSVIFVSATNYEVVGNRAFINDSRAYIEAPYMIHSSGEQYFIIQSKSYTGDITVFFGYNSSEITPSQPYRYVKKGQISSLTCENEYTYTVNPNFLTCYAINGSVAWEHSFDSANVQTKTIYFNEYWYDTENLNRQFTKLPIKYDKKDSWYYMENIPIEAGKEYIFGTTFDIEEGVRAKYDLAFMPSSYDVSAVGLSAAIANGHFYMLDPLIDTADIVAWWDMQTGSGTNLIDSSGNIANKAFSGTPTWVNDGEPSNLPIGLHFDGDTETDSINIGDIDFFDTDFSISFWFNMTGSDNTYIYEKGNTGASGAWLGTGIASDGSGSLLTYFDNGVTAYSLGEGGTGGLDDNSPHHVVIVRSGNNLYQYLDGALDDSELITFDTIDNNEDFGIGRREFNGNRYFNGTLHQFIIFNTALNLPSVQELYNSGHGVTYDGYFSAPPVIHYFSIRAYDNDSMAYINTFNASFNNSFFDTTNGTIVTTYKDTSGIFNITVMSDGFSTVSYLHNLTTNLTAYMYPIPTTPVNDTNTTGTDTGTTTTSVSVNLQEPLLIFIIFVMIIGMYLLAFMYRSTAVFAGSFGLAFTLVLAYFVSEQYFSTFTIYTLPLLIMCVLLIGVGIALIIDGGSR